MNGQVEQRDNGEHEAPSKDSGETGQGTEAAHKGGKEPARRQAERDFQDSAQESGE